MPRKLLLADDSVTIQRVIELTFADEDIQVIAVGDGKQAIERVERERPDIVLADVGMPERDGYEVAAFIKGNPALAQIPVVLLTGAFEPIDESRARAVGCDGVLVKPFEPQMVISRVRDLLAGHRPANLWAASPAAQGPVRRADSDRGPASGAPAPTGDSLEAYFDRLDAAFSGANDAADAPAVQPAAAMPPAAPSAQPAPTAPPPTVPYMPPSASAAQPVDDLSAWDPDLTGDPAQRVPPAFAADRAASAPAWTPPSPTPASTSASFTAPAQPAAAPAAPAAPPPSLVDAFAALLTAEQRTPISPSGSVVPGGDALDERTLDDIARRVAARLNLDTMRPAVLEIAERLVRDEIERLKQNR